MLIKEKSMFPRLWCEMTKMDIFTFISILFSTIIKFYIMAKVNIIRNFKKAFTNISVVFKCYFK